MHWKPPGSNVSPRTAEGSVSAYTNLSRRSAVNPRFGHILGLLGCQRVHWLPKFVAPSFTGRHHPAVHGIANPALNALDAFVQSAVEGHRGQCRAGRSVF